MGIQGFQGSENGRVKANWLAAVPVSAISQRLLSAVINGWKSGSWPLI